MTPIFNFPDKELAEYIELSPKAFSEMKRQHPKRYELYRLGYMIKSHDFTPQQLAQIIALKQTFMPQKQKTIDEQRESIERMVVQGQPIGRIANQTGVSTDVIKEKLAEWGGQAFYSYRLHIARGRLINIKNIYLREERYKKQLPNTDLWGGADVIIDMKEHTDTDKTVVVTQYAKELSWLFSKIRDAFEDVVDYLDKYKFYGLLAESAIDFIKDNGDNNEKLLLEHVHSQANEIWKEMRRGSFDSDVFEAQSIKAHKTEK